MAPHSRHAVCCFIPKKTQRLIELVPKAGIKTIVAEKKGPLPRDPVGITMFTREDLN